MKEIQLELKHLYLNKLAYSSQLKKKQNTETELTFKPQINAASVEMDMKHDRVGAKVAWETGTDHDEQQEQDSPTQRHEKLYRTKEVFDKKIEKEREKQDKNEMKECTFAPRINPKKPKKKPELANHFEHLYNQRSKKAMPITSTRDEKEMRECTFAPKIYTKPTYV